MLIEEGGRVVAFREGQPGSRELGRHCQLYESSSRAADDSATVRRGEEEGDPAVPMDLFACRPRGSGSSSFLQLA